MAGLEASADRVSEDVYQQPLLLRVRFEGNFLWGVKNIFKFLKIRTPFNSLPGYSGGQGECLKDAMKDRRNETNF